ncbi:MAG: DUF1573 domain-containing protein [Bacteroidales bacterium]|nr:DUF1573 domain-containing protein [Bacteroidales bacterium]
MLQKIGIFFLTATLSGMLMLGISHCKKKDQKKDSEDKTESSQAEVSKNKPLPRIVVKEGKKRNLGKLKEGIKTTVVFTMINKGDADASNISVHDLSKGGCTAVSKVSRLATGDSAKLKFIFETLGYGGKKETRKIKVRYDNPRLSPLTLSVTAEVLPTKAHQVPIGELYYNFFVLVDIRNEQAFREGHIAGAIHVPSDELLEWASRLPKDFMIYLCSENGKESDKMAKKLRNNGFTEALSIIGGIEEWKSRYGERVIIQGSQ